MKITKKFKGMLSLALTAMLTLGSVTANATSNVGAVLPDPTEKGSITIHKYEIGSMSNAGAPATGLKNEGQVPAGSIPLNGIEFKVQSLTEYDSEKHGTIASDNTITFEDKNYQVVTNDGIVYFIDKRYEETKTTDTVSIEGKKEDGIAEFKDLEQGIYLVTESENSGVVEKGAPFLVSIPMAHPVEQNSWLYDVHVYPKNVVTGEPGVDKFVTEEENKHDTANIGDNVTWIIKSNIPADIADAKSYVITDELDSQLNYTGNLTVYYLEEGENKVTKVPISEEWYEVVSEPTIKGGVMPTKDKQIIEISFNEAGRKELSKLYYPENGEGRVLAIRISFTTLINSSAELGVAIPNDVTLSYTNSSNDNNTPGNPDNPGTPDNTEKYHPDELPEVHTGGVLLEKVDASDNNVKLQGAKFKIYPTLKDAKDGTNAIVNPADKTEEWEVTTDEDGIAIFKGLSYGTTGNAVDQGLTTYWIVETVAPTYDVVVGKDENGENIIEKKQYNLLKAPLEVTVTATSHLESNKVVVENRKFTLPVTGGVGTVIFTLGGLAIMGAAAFLYMRTTRRA